jgi:hypothetical protein
MAEVDGAFHLSLQHPVGLGGLQTSFLSTQKK